MLQWLAECVLRACYGEWSTRPSVAAGGVVVSRWSVCDVLEGRPAGQLVAAVLLSIISAASRCRVGRRPSTNLVKYSRARMSVDGPSPVQRGTAAVLSPGMHSDFREPYMAASPPGG